VSAAGSANLTGRRSTLVLAFLSGVVVATVAGLIGLGGAEFRLPVLIGLFGFVALEAVVLNKAVSLIVVGAALLFRSRTVPITDVILHASIIGTLLAGSVLGAWLGADLATRLNHRALYRVIAVLLLGIAFLLLFAHEPSIDSEPILDGILQTIAGVASGFVIGVVASFLGVAGGELLIPTLVLLFGLDIKLAGSLSLTVSLPTMLVGFTRYSVDKSFLVLTRHRRFLFAMASGSIAGALIGGLLLGIVPGTLLIPLLAIILVLSAVKIWRHK
jgi:uncharacterized membrane protein YfcA